LRGAVQGLLMKRWVVERGCSRVAGEEMEQMQK
jgi:hypothetical protein